MPLRHDTLDEAIAQIRKDGKGKVQIAGLQYDACMIVGVKAGPNGNADECVKALEEYLGDETCIHR